MSENIDKKLVKSIQIILTQSVIKKIDLGERLQKFCIEIGGIDIIILYRLEYEFLMEVIVYSYDRDKNIKLYIGLTESYSEAFEKAIYDTLSNHKPEQETQEEQAEERIRLWLKDNEESNKSLREQLIEQTQALDLRREAKRDMDFINKVAVEAMRSFVALDINSQIKLPELQSEAYTIIAEISYKQAKAMLAQSKIVEQELLNKEVTND